MMGNGRYGKAVDMWSIGVILYVLLCGVPPFEDDVLFEQIEGADFDKTCERWSKISPDARDLISKLLIKSPIKRLTALGASKHPFLERNLEKYHGRASIATNSTIDTSTEDIFASTSVSDENDATASGQILTHKNGTTSKRKREAVVDVSAEKKRKLDGEETDAADTSTTTKSTNDSSNGDVLEYELCGKRGHAF